MNRLLISVLALAVLSAACGHSRPGAIVAAPSSEDSPVGFRLRDVVLDLDDADYVHPSLSPSGRILAVSEVVTESAYENTRILVFDLETGIRDTLITTDQARGYGVYASYVAAMDWMAEDKLLISIYDGDVNGTQLTIHVPSKQILEQEFLEEDDFPLLPTDRSVVAKRLESLYPEIRPPKDFSGSSIFENSLRRAVLVGDKGVILQKNFAGFDHDIWYYSLTAPQAVRFDMPNLGAHSFGGGACHGDTAVFLVTTDSTGRLYSFDGNEPVLEVATPVTLQSAYTTVKHHGIAGVWLKITTAHSYEPGHNPAVWFDGENVVEARFGQLLHDYDVCPASGMVAVVRWTGDRRSVYVGHF